MIPSASSPYTNEQISILGIRIFQIKLMITNKQRKNQRVMYQI